MIAIVPAEAFGSGPVRFAPKRAALTVLGLRHSPHRARRLSTGSY